MHHPLCLAPQLERVGGLSHVAEVFAIAAHFDSAESDPVLYRLLADLCSGATDAHGSGQQENVIQAQKDYAELRTAQPSALP